MALQASAGNQAVSGLLASGPPVVQRLVATRPADLDKFIGASDTLRKAVGGKLEPSKQSFVQIRRALSDYRSAVQKGKAGPEALAQQLTALDILCTKFVNEHGGDKKRRAVIAKLQEEVSNERMALSKQQAGDIYQANIANARQVAPSEEADPGKKFGFKALTSEAKLGATNHSAEIAKEGYTGPKRPERIKQMQEKYKLTDSEVSAITVFSAGDFSYINPVTANSPKWLASQRGDTTSDWARRSDKTLKEEGSLHAGMAVQGLEKMDPYEGETFRGARFTPEEFAARFYMGKAMPFTSLASTSKERDIALNFVFGIGAGATSDPAKSVGVLTVISDSGGRDISDIALVQKEAEVLILPGSVFNVVSIEPVDGEGEYAEKHAEATQLGKPVPEKYFVVRLEPSQVKASDVRDTRWRGARPGMAADPFAIPKSVGILGQDRARPDRGRP